MKEKLQKVREALDNIPTMYAIGLYTDANETFAETVALIDSIIAELDSPELVEKVARYIEHELHAFNIEAAEAAIEAITNNN